MADEVSTERLLQVVEDEGRALLEFARGGELGLAVPGCPGWALSDLVTHLASVYRWVGVVVGEGRRERPERVETEDPSPLHALETAHARLLEVLHAASPELDCWTIWPAPNALHYWVRRQAHETLVHRVDAQNAVTQAILGSVEADPVIAADGVDEMVTGFAQRFHGRLRSSVPATISLHATDVDRRWWIRLGPGELESGRGEVGQVGEARTEVKALSGELLLLLWNRRTWDGLTVTGDDGALRAWQRGARL